MSNRAHPTLDDVLAGRDWPSLSAYARWANAGKPVLAEEEKRPQDHADCEMLSHEIVALRANAIAKDARINELENGQQNRDRTIHDLQVRVANSYNAAINDASRMIEDYQEPEFNAFRDLSRTIRGLKK